MSENIETEVKIAVDDETFDRAFAKLGKEMHTKWKGPRGFSPEQNIFYRTPEGFLRLRNYGERVFVTCKGKREDLGDYNSREEIEFEHYAEDFEKLQTFFSRLGLEKYFEYTKQRANIYFHDGFIGGVEATASFDVLPNGQRYIEIEDSDIGVINKAVTFLGLQGHTKEKRSYLEILMEEREGNGVH